MREAGYCNSIVAETVVQGGPAYGKVQIQNGDILLEVGGEVRTCLWQCMYMDGHVVGELSLKVWRIDREIDVWCRVGDLFINAPRRAIRRFGCLFHHVSSKLVVYHSIAVKIIYIASVSTTADSFELGMISNPSTTHLFRTWNDWRRSSTAWVWGGHQSHHQSEDTR
ncbi:hypothetical protein CONLIGDRAFT_638559 [Coniochaeta ligniaria NRRL 30616]|uniref:PDZ domain-containing protein n=1 Tax=Coniochaeta ligniaria NRRL 30616 TaxID=1408157 RepID=A0A1J7IZ28_9PEZI|nr:hypothetical protein CONLIGDRAFT_638559 [Coniochaeta ligniaria NRRL 30616]